MSRNAVSDFWHSSSCSVRIGNNVDSVSVSVHTATTFRVSTASRTALMNCLSMFWNRFASCGSCFTMSPPLNTASMYTHMFCTTSHISMISPTVDSFAIHSWTSSLNGAEYRFVAMDPSAICESSSFSMSSAVGATARHTSPRFLYG